jgi:hypothetical protein
MGEELGHEPFRLKAMATKEGYEPSEVVSGDFAVQIHQDHYPALEAEYWIDPNDQHNYSSPAAIR